MMRPVNINEVDEFDPVELFGKLCLLSYQRIDDASIPEGLFKYDLRHGDDWGVPCAISNTVICNYFGTIITNREFPVDLDENFVTLKCDDDNFDLDYIESQGLEDEDLDRIPSDIQSYIKYNDRGGYDIPKARISPKGNWGLSKTGEPLIID